MKRNFTILLILMVVLFSLSAENREVITQWTFDGTTEPVVGTGSVSLIGGTIEHTIDAINGWRFFNFPVQGSGSGTAGARLMVSTEGYKNVVLEFEQRASGTASRWAEFQYTIDGGTNWISYGNNFGGLNPRDIFHPFSMIFTDVSEVNNNPNFGVRVVSIFSPVPFNPGVPNLDFGANLAFHRARDWNDGGEEYSPAGNWRLRDVVFSGEVILVDDPVKLDFISINDGEIVYSDIPFEVSVGVFDSNNQPAAVTADTEVVVTLAEGNGTLFGTTTGVISQGTYSTTVTGMIYDMTEQSVRLSAAAVGLESGTSSLFDVIAPLWNLNLESNLPGAGMIVGEGEYYEGDQVTIEAAALNGFEFIYWRDKDGSLFSDNAYHQFEMPANELSLTAIFETMRGEEIIHYWHFNELPAVVGLTEVPADYSSRGDAMITYPGTGTGYMDSYDPGSVFNLEMDELAGLALRLRNPAATRQMIIEAPSAGYENLVMSFEVHRSNNGPTQQNLYYSIDRGTNWVPIELGYSIETDYTVKSFPLSVYPDVNDEANLQFRILFTGENYTGATGNNRFDNILLTGDPINGQTSIFHTDIESPEILVHPNPSDGRVLIRVPQPRSFVQVLSVTGQVMFETQAVTGDVEVITDGFPVGVYLVRVSGMDDPQTATAKFMVK